MLTCAYIVLPQLVISAGVMLKDKQTLSEY